MCEQLHRLQCKLSLTTCWQCPKSLSLLPIANEPKVSSHQLVRTRWRQQWWWPEFFFAKDSEEYDFYIWRECRVCRTVLSTRVERQDFQLVRFLPWGEEMGKILSLGRIDSVGENCCLNGLKWESISTIWLGASFRCVFNKVKQFAGWTFYELLTSVSMWIEVRISLCECVYTNYEPWKSVTCQPFKTLSSSQPRFKRDSLRMLVVSDGFLQ